MLKCANQNCDLLITQCNNIAGGNPPILWIALPITVAIIVPVIGVTVYYVGRNKNKKRVGDMIYEEYVFTNITWY